MSMMYRQKGHKLLVHNSFTNRLWGSWKADLSVGDKAVVTNLFLVIYKNRNSLVSVGIFLQPHRQPDSTAWMFEEQYFKQNIVTYCSHLSEQVIKKYIVYLETSKLMWIFVIKVHICMRFMHLRVHTHVHSAECVL